MVSPPYIRTRSSPWRFALIGALASLPITAVLNWLPNSEATIGGGMMLIGAFIAGGLAVIRATDSGASGLRAGFLGGVVGVLTFIVTTGTTAAWPLSSVAFFALASMGVLCVAPLFGLVCGRLGGWVATTVLPRLKTGANAS